MERKGTKDARYPEFLTTTSMDASVKSEDNTTDDGTRPSLEGEGLSAAASSGLHQREAYCLLVWVTCNVDSVSMLDAKVPDYVWTEAIAWDICAYQVGTPANAFIIELLCATEFLLFKGPRSSPGITWENVIKYIRVLHDIHDWGGMEVTVVAGQHTMRQSQIDLDNTREYHRVCILGRLAAVEGKAKTLALENAKTLTPMGRGRVYTRRADWYLTQKVAGSPALEPSLYPLRSATLEDYLQSLRMRVKSWKVLVPTPVDTLLLQPQYPTVAPITLNRVIPRIETINTRNRNIQTARQVRRLMRRS